MADLHVITGPPCSGKSTYLQAHAKDGEVRVDLDLIATALGAPDPYVNSDARSAAIAARQGAIDRILDESLPAWVIHGDPTDEQRARYETAGAVFVPMDTSMDECLERAEADNRPPQTFALIREWFDRHDERQAPRGAFFMTREATMPFKPQERQYRSFAASNFTALDTEAEQPSYRVRGYWTTFEDPYELEPGWFETIDRHALDNAHMSDVIMQYDHAGDVLARQRNDSLTVSVDEHGGFCEAYLGGCQRGRELFESIKNGLVDEMSFGFTIADDGFEWEEDENGIIRTRITHISRVYDVSAVSIPANASTSIISARSYLDGAIEARRKQQEVLRRAQAARRKRRAAAMELDMLR